jgi:hypothetical protein
MVVAELRELGLQAPSASSSPIMPPSSNTFEVVEDCKVVHVSPVDPAKTVQIGAGLNPK